MTAARTIADEPHLIDQLEEVIRRAGFEPDTEALERMRRYVDEPIGIDGEGEREREVTR